MLEDHGDGRATQGAQPPSAHGREVVVAEHDAPGGRPPEPVEHADERGLARARQAHDDEDLALRHLEGGVDDCSGAVLLDVVPRCAVTQATHGLLGSSAEDLIDVLYAYRRHAERARHLLSGECARGDPLVRCSCAAARRLSPCGRPRLPGLWAASERHQGSALHQDLSKSPDHLAPLSIILLPEHPHFWRFLYPYFTPILA